MVPKMNIDIKGKMIGDSRACFVVAELSANHNGSLSRAITTIKAAKACGADAIKLQTYTPDTMTLNCRNKDFLIEEGLWEGQYLHDLYESAYTPYEWHKALFDAANQEGIICFSTPFDETAIDLLESLDTPAYKIASFELTDLSLIENVAKCKKPIILSTGMASKEEISEALEVIRKYNLNEVVLLHCVSAYPASLDEMNLRMIPKLRQEFGVLTGLSDHSKGTLACTIAASLGACLVEKHFTMNRADGGADSEFSIEPKELKKLCNVISDVHVCLGNDNYPITETESKNLKFRRSIYCVKRIEAGAIIKKENLRVIRPGYGLSPKYYDDLVGKKAKVTIEPSTAIHWKLIV